MLRVGVPVFVYSRLVVSRCACTSQQFIYWFLACYLPRAMASLACVDLILDTPPASPVHEPDPMDAILAPGIVSGGALEMLEGVRPKKRAKKAPQNNIRTILLL